MNLCKFIKLLVLQLCMLNIPAWALNTRSFVSTNGLDTNACTVTAPCRNFAAAIAATASNGEVIALNSGGFGNGFTITQPVTLIAPKGVYVGIGVSGTAGAIVNTPSNTRVIFDGISFIGLGGGIGIQVIGGGGIGVKDCTFRDMNVAGIEFSPISYIGSLVDNSTFISNNIAILVQDYANVIVKNTEIIASNDSAVKIENLSPNTGSYVNIVDSTFVNNHYGIWASATDSTSPVNIFTINTKILDSHVDGVYAIGSALAGNMWGGNFAYSGNFDINVDSSSHIYTDGRVEAFKINTSTGLITGSGFFH